VKVKPTRAQIKRLYTTHKKSRQHFSKEKLAACTPGELSAFDGVMEQVVSFPTLKQQLDSGSVVLSTIE
jgi:hypothetical protein